MSCCDDPCQPLAIEVGVTYVVVYRYGGAPLIYKPIAAVTAYLPLTLTATAHGVTDGWPVAFRGLGSGVDASDWPPTNKDFFFATVVDANTISINDLDATVLTAYTSGGILAYYTPTSLAGATAVFTLSSADSCGNETVVLTTNAVLDNTAKTITLTLSAAQTAALITGAYTFSLIMTDAGSNVIVIAEGQAQVSMPGSGSTSC